LELSVGRAATLHAGAKEVESAFLKHPVRGRVTLSIDGLPGDEHVYHTHGGPDRALLTYPYAHYAYWRQEYGLDLPEYSAFGENFTTDGLTEDEVHIGDIFEVGGAQVQVTQSRHPCYKIGARYKVPQLTLTVMKNGYTGILYRVLSGGEVGAGDTLTLIHRESHGVTVAMTNRIIHDPKDLEGAAKLLEIDSLAEFQKAAMRARLQGRDGHGSNGSHSADAGQSSRRSTSSA
jgi:MOSC domain-containing protein YiiM